MLRIHFKFNVLHVIPICLITWIIVALFEQDSQLPLKNLSKWLWRSPHHLSICEKWMNSIMVSTEIPRSTQRAMEVFSDSLELVDFVIGLLNSVLKLSFS